MEREGRGPGCLPADTGLGVSGADARAEGTAWAVALGRCFMCLKHSKEAGESAAQRADRSGGWSSNRKNYFGSGGYGEAFDFILSTWEARRVLSIGVI